MKIAYWQPKDDSHGHYEQPFLEVPSPYDYLPMEPPREEAEEEESPRVIIIDM
ncbi:MAG: hypothetical protein KC635_25155 [Myxococcales bacterium]|nr:hypothetical protein [Myxococcales bacterium]MCB9733874.1 hypothetical protein [Deltaproteobacteria bacterium]